MDFKTSIWAVTNPAVQPQLQCSSVTARPESDALHTSLNNDSPPLHERWHPLGLLTGYEPFAETGFPIARASCHREQIVEQLAQCR